MATLGEKEEQFADLREKRVKVMSDKIKIQAMIRYGKNHDSGPRVGAPLYWKYRQK